MALLDARCTSCGAALKVDGGLDTAYCIYCGAKYIIEKAVQNFYVNIQAQNVIVQGDVQNARSDFEVRGGVLLKYHGSATEVMVPDGVVVIGNKQKGKEIFGAFEGCSGITKVVLPASVQMIDKSAFKDCKCLREINVPVGVTEIGYDAFSGCKNLRSITVRDPERYSYSNKAARDILLAAGMNHPLVIYNPFDDTPWYEAWLEAGGRKRSTRKNWRRTS